VELLLQKYTCENCRIVSSFVWTKRRNVTEGQTDRQKWSS